MSESNSRGEGMHQQNFQPERATPALFI